MLAKGGGEGGAAFTCERLPVTPEGVLDLEASGFVNGGMGGWLGGGD